MCCDGDRFVASCYCHWLSCLNEMSVCLNDVLVCTIINEMPNTNFIFHILRIAKFLFTFSSLRFSLISSSSYFVLFCVSVSGFRHSLSFFVLTNACQQTKNDNNRVCYYFFCYVLHSFIASIRNPVLMKLQTHTHTHSVRANQIYFRVTENLIKKIQAV